MENAARRIVERLRRNGCVAYFAGGWVRDRLLGRTSTDIDIATSALPDEVLRLFPNSTAIGAAFGVVQVRAYGRTYDVATFRSEGPYLDGRHPSSVVFTGAEQDAIRRDFTVNGLFYDPVGRKVIDYVQGRADLRRRVLRAIGDPADRFAEDRLRMLRAVRLACVLDFRIEAATWGAVHRLACGIRSVSAERVRDEMVKLLTAAGRARGLDLLHESGLLAQILPEVEHLVGVPGPDGGDLLATTRIALGLLRKPSTELALATLLHRVGGKREGHTRPEPHAGSGESAVRKICRRLRFPNAVTARVADLVEQLPRLAGASNMRESALKRILRKPVIGEHLELLRVASLSQGSGLGEYRYCLGVLGQQLYEPCPALPLLTGRDLIELGYAPGPLFKKILDAVEDLRLEHSLRTRREALQYVRRSYPRTPDPAREGAQ